VNGKVYVNEGSLVRVVNPTLEKATGSIVLRTGGGGFGSALKIAASGDGQTLLASYVVLQLDGGPVDGGVIELNTAVGGQKAVHSMPFVPYQLASNPAGTLAFGVGYLNSSQVGVIDLVAGGLVKQAVTAGADYLAVASSTDGSLVYAVDSHGKVDFLQVPTLQLVASVPVGVHPAGIAVSPDGTRALVTDSASHSATVLDLSVPRVVGAVPLGAPSSGALFLRP
jgi:DNA-binding beta-propeller fold protein YncE